MITFILFYQQSISLRLFCILTNLKIIDKPEQRKFITRSMSMPHPSAGTNRPARVCYNGIAYKAYRGVRAYEFARVYPTGTTVYPLHRLCVGTCLGLPLSPSANPRSRQRGRSPNPNQRHCATRYP